MKYELKPCPFCGGKVQMMITPERKLELIKNMQDLYNVLVRRVVSFNHEGQGDQDAKKMRQDFTDVIRIIGEHSGMQRTLNSRWIPASERLPEDAQEVLALLDDGSYALVTNDFDGFADNHNHYMVGEVTHWMPLPESPEV